METIEKTRLADLLNKKVEDLTFSVRVRYGCGVLEIESIYDLVIYYTKNETQIKKFFDKEGRKEVRRFIRQNGLNNFQGSKEKIINQLNNLKTLINCPVTLN